MVRRFLTSAAIDQQEDDTYILRSLTTDDGILSDAAIDNFDKNNNTIDGRTTTHSMAAVTYKRSYLTQTLKYKNMHGGGGRINKVVSVGSD